MQEICVSRCCCPGIYLKEGREMGGGSVVTLHQPGSVAVCLAILMSHGSLVQLPSQRGQQFSYRWPIGRGRCCLIWGWNTEPRLRQADVCPTFGSGSGRDACSAPFLPSFVLPFCNCQRTCARLLDFGPAVGTLGIFRLGISVDYASVFACVPYERESSICVLQWE